MAHDVFISYSPTDSKVAEAICDWLELRGLRCWMAPRDVAPGTEYVQSILRAVDECRILVLIFSNQANNSRQIVVELEQASRHRIPILAIRIENALPTRQLENFVSSSDWMDAFLRPLEAQRQIFADTVYERLDRRWGSLDEIPVTYENLPFWMRIADILSQIVIWVGVFSEAMGMVWSSFRRLFVRSNTDRLVAKQIADELFVNHLEELAEFSVSQSLRPVLSSLALGLPDRIDRVAQQAAQVLRLQDPIRRVEAAQAGLRSLDEIQQGLVGQPDVIAEAGNRVVTSWTELLRQASEEAKAAAEQASEIENPFIFGNPVHAKSAGLFTGRRDIALEIERSILRAAQTPTLLLYGQRRMGKTSILNQLPALLGPSFLPVLVDCQAPATVESQAALLRHASRCLVSALKFRPGLVRGHKDKDRTASTEPLPLERLQSDPFSAFEDWLDEFQSNLEPDGHILACLDEFERLNEIVAAGWGKRFLDALRHWSQHRPKFTLMFIGSHTFEQLGPVWTDRFLSARRLKISFLDGADVQKLLTEPTPTFNLKYAPGALETILTVTRGQPFLTQVLASELVHHLNHERKKLAKPEDVEIAINDALERSAEYFAELWSSRTEQERDMLRAVARGKPQALVNPIARGLRDYDVLDDTGNFAVPLVMRWVQLNKLHDQSTV
jgi:uncharacterized protein